MAKKEWIDLHENKFKCKSVLDIFSQAWHDIDELKSYYLAFFKDQEQYFEKLTPFFS